MPCFGCCFILSPCFFGTVGDNRYDFVSWSIQNLDECAVESRSTYETNQDYMITWLHDYMSLVGLEDCMSTSRLGCLSIFNITNVSDFSRLLKLNHDLEPFPSCQVRFRASWVFRLQIAQPLGTDKTRMEFNRWNLKARPCKCVYIPRQLQCDRCINLRNWVAAQQQHQQQREQRQ